MKIGYPCVNRSIGCLASSTFRLASYSKDKFLETVANNLACLKEILAFNREHGLNFFRISSDTVPFASHPVCTVKWEKHFNKELKEIGQFVKKSRMRISMHPGQYTVINSPHKDIVDRSIKELVYHCRLLDAMGLDTTAKVQIHVGGIYKDKAAAMKRFIAVYRTLPETIIKRLVIENDDVSYSLKDCLEINSKTKTPIIFDNFHHECLNNNEPLTAALEAASTTWAGKDGLPMVDYSSQEPGEKKGRHITHLDAKLFRSFIKGTTGLDFDIMCEIKDKEPSAIEALRIARKIRQDLP